MAIKQSSNISDGVINYAIYELMLYGGSLLGVYDGVQPAYPGSGDVVGNNLLVQFSGISWVDGTSGTSASRALSTRILGTAATTGTATWARLSDGNKIFCIDGVCGTAGTCDFIINTTQIVKGQTIVLRAATLVKAT